MTNRTHQSSHLLPQEQQFLKEAAQFLEHPGVAIRIANKLGQPSEYLESKLPDKARHSIQTATHTALKKALKMALMTIPDTAQNKGFKDSEWRASKSNWAHVAGSAVTGAMGGMFGLPSLALELPVTTTLMLRSIAQNARAFGANLNDPRVQLECLYIFSLGTPSSADDATETSYYASRLGLGQLITQAASYISAHSAKEILSAIEKGSAPVLVRLIANIAGKFEIAVSEKVLVEAIPIIGAAGGAVVNSVFTHYFNEAARYHFGIRKLELEHGADVVQALYQRYARGRG
jgi:hypothetical protein